MPPKASKKPSKAAASNQQPSLGSLPFNFGSMPPAGGKMEFKMQVSWKPDPAPSAPKAASKAPRKRKTDGDSAAATPTPKKPAPSAPKAASKAPRKRKPEGDSTATTPTPKKPRTPATAKGQAAAARTPAKRKATAKVTPKSKNNEAVGMGMAGGATSRSTPYVISNDRLLPENGFSTTPSSSPLKQAQPPASKNQNYSSPTKTKTKNNHSISAPNTQTSPYATHQAAQRAYEAQIARELGVSQSNPSDAPPSYEQSFYDRKLEEDDDDDDDGAANETCGYVFTFGKHYGKSFEQVLHEAPGYIDWCIREDVGSDPQRRDLAPFLERYRRGEFD